MSEHITEYYIGDTLISMMVSDENLHYGPGDSRAEIVVKTGDLNYWPDPIWIGDPAKANQVRAWISRHLGRFPCSQHGYVVEQLEKVMLLPHNRARMGICG